MKKLNELYEKVRFFNKENAKRFLDDALKELDYMDNPNDSKMSLRLFKITHPDIIID